MNLQREYGEKLSERMKIAAITSMRPGGIQDLVFQQADKLEDYGKAREQNKAIVLNRIACAGGPVPMDCGSLGQWDTTWWSGEETGEGSTVLDMDAVSGNVQCHKCNGWGHLARECPSKGNKGKGKGKGKGKNSIIGMVPKGKR